MALFTAAKQADLESEAFFVDDIERGIDKTINQKSPDVIHTEDSKEGYAIDFIIQGESTYFGILNLENGKFQHKNFCNEDKVRGVWWIHNILLENGPCDIYLEDSPLWAHLIFGLNNKGFKYVTGRKSITYLSRIENRWARLFSKPLVTNNH